MPENAKYANVKMPAAFLTPHEFTAKDGRTFEKAYVHFPEGTKVKGLKAANEGFKAEKAAEREAAKEQGATLKGESEQMRESSAKLAGDNTPEEHANTR